MGADGSANAPRCGRNRHPALLSLRGAGFEQGGDLGDGFGAGTDVADGDTRPRLLLPPWPHRDQGMAAFLPVAHQAA
jgi:hypothetical protein